MLEEMLVSETWRMRALSKAGQIILENGGETYRAENTVLRMALALGLRDVSVFAVPSGLFISYTDENDEQSTSVTRSHLQSIHLCRVDQVNQISRRLTSGELNPEELLSSLEEAENLCRDAPSWFSPAMAGIIAACFSAVFGGGPVDAVTGALCAALTQVLSCLWKNAGISVSLLGSVFCSMIPLLFQALTGLGTPEAMVAAAIMPLVPGLSMTNAVQDILRGDMISGLTHAARAVMLAALIAGGTLIGTHLFGYLSLPHQPARQAQSVTVLWKMLLIFTGSSIGAMAFGGFLYAPRKAIFWGGLLGGVGYTFYWLALRLGISDAVAMFLGALLSALGGQLAACKLKMISTISITLAILPLVPGLGLYRAMNVIAQGQTGPGLEIAASTMASILMIALGVGCGSQLAEVLRKREKTTAIQHQ